MKIDLKDSFIKSIVLSDLKEKNYTSSLITGLQLKIKPARDIYRYEWHLRYNRPNGRANSLKLGDWPHMDQEHAYDKAQSC